MIRDGEPTAEFQVEVKRASERALLVAFFDDAGEQSRQEWIPRSQVDERASEVALVGDQGTLVVSEWIAKQKGLL